MKPLKAWAVIDPEDNELVWRESRPMIYDDRQSAIFNRYVGYKVIPVLITLIKRKK